MMKKVAKSAVFYFRHYSIHDWKKYLFSTHFWGPLCGWAIPMAAISDLSKSPEIISGKMTIALCIYSSTFMRFAWIVEPRNLLLLCVHCTNLGAQGLQLSRFVLHRMNASTSKSKDNKLIIDK